MDGVTKQKVIEHCLKDTYPHGSKDSGGRFYLAVKFDCCQGLRSPSRAYPWSEWTHGKSLKHKIFEALHDHGVEANSEVIKQIRGRWTGSPFAESEGSTGREKRKQTQQ